MVFVNLWHKSPIGMSKERYFAFASSVNIVCVCLCCILLWQYPFDMIVIFDRIQIA